MNQIICTSNSNIDNNYSFKMNKKQNFIKIQFFIFFFVSMLAALYYINLKNDINSSEEFAKNLMDKLSLSKLYGASSEYNAQSLNQEIYFYENSSFSVIGSINIEKIEISYPILSDINKSLLKLSPCRFYRTGAK